MKFLEKINKDSSPHEMEDVAKICGDKISYGDTSLMLELTELLKPIIEKGGHLPYHQIILATNYYFTGRLNEAEDMMVNLCKVEWLSDPILGWIYVLRGSNLRSLGEIDKAVEFLSLGLRLIPENCPLEVFVVFAYYHLGSINVIFDEFESAEENFLQGVKQAEKINNKTAVYRCSLGLGALYTKIDKLSLANQYLLKAKDLAGNNRPFLSNTYYELAVYYFAKDKREKALEMCNQSIEIRISEKLFDAVNTANILKSKILIKNGIIEEAIELITETLISVRSFTTKLKERDCLELLTEAHEKNSDSVKALQYLKQFNKLQFSILNIQYKEILKQKNKYILEQKNEIEQQHKAIKSSIRYSKNLQNAILPSQDLMRKYFPSNFIYYKPKDIVAGDFYWLNTPEMRSKNVGENIILFAVADCTGHGVPGAIVSFICSDILNRAVHQYQLVEPAEILDKTLKLIIARFGMNNNLITDGMDISLGALNTKTLELKWSGANNPIYFIRDKKLTEIKGDKQAIGYVEKIKSFTSHSVQLQKGDLLYLSSDGFPDQFGGIRGKKFTYQKYRKLLLDTHQNSMKEQIKMISKSYTDWTRTEDQVDDICVMGIEI